MRLFATCGFDLQSKPKISIDRNVYFDAILLKRKRIVTRRTTLAQPQDAANESFVEPHSANIQKTSGRSIFGIGRPTKSFRSIANRRSSAPQNRSHEQPVELFDVPINKINENDDGHRIEFGDINFGRLTDD